MGGIGSGRPYGAGKKKTTDDYISLDIRTLKRLGVLNEGKHKVRWARGRNRTNEIEISSEKGKLILDYRFRLREGSWQDISLPIELSFSECHVGGLRPWFICPVARCSKRVAILYGAEVFICRHCLNLGYGSQYESSEMRAVRQAYKIREQLGWPLSVMDGVWKRPKHMHKSTYEKKLKQYFKYVRAANLK